MSFLQYKKVKVYYKIYGVEGPWIVLINGHTRSSSDFRSFASSFEKKGFRVLVFDNRGAGQTKIQELFSLEDIADDLMGIINYLMIERLHVICFSLGGIIARCFSYKYMEKVKTMSLISSPFDGSFLKKRSEESWGKRLSDVEKKLSTYVAEDFLVKNPKVIKGMAARIFFEMKDSFLERSYHQKLALERTSSAFFTIKETVRRVLVIHGDQDQVIAVSEAKHLKEQCPQTRLEIIPGAGHLLLLEKPKALLQMLSSFINKYEEEALT